MKERKLINWLQEQGYVYRDAKGKLKPHAQHTETI
ncbi:phage antirepressor KilAC domain-containing protein [Paenibacillus popilliae]|nr:phage antirepressor KilAC domain-containing protein [Paenibacillus popilliae]